MPLLAASAVTFGSFVTMHASAGNVLPMAECHGQGLDLHRDDSFVVHTTLMYN